MNHRNSVLILRLLFKPFYLKEVEKIMTEILNTKVLSLDMIREAQDVTEKNITVSEWGGDVVVRSITKRQMKDIKNNAKGSDGEMDDDEVEKQIFLAGLCSPAVSEADYEWMQDKSASAMTKVLGGILGQSNMTKDSEKDAEKSIPA